MGRKKINVIHIITQLAVGGATENTIITATHLNSKRFNTIIVSGKEDLNKNLLDRVKKNKIPYFVNKNLIRYANPLKDLLCLVTLIKFIREHKGIIVHTHSSKAGILGRISAYLAGSKIIIHTVHGWSFHPWLKKWEMFVFILLERLTAVITNKLICVTNQDVFKGLSSNIGDWGKYDVIRSGFDTKCFLDKDLKTEEIKKNFNLPLNKKIVGTIGRLSKQKDPETFVKVAYIVSQQREDVIFVFVGGGELRSKVEKMISNLRLNEKVFLLGTQNQIEKVFPIFDVFLLTSLWEGLPKVVPQAMASGIPVVSTAVDGVKEVIKDGENGFLSSPKDVKSLAKNVMALLDDEELRRKFSSNSYQIVKKFDSNLMVEEIQKLYLNLL